MSLRRTFRDVPVKQRDCDVCQLYYLTRLPNNSARYEKHQPLTKQFNKQNKHSEFL